MIAVYLANGSVLTVDDGDQWHTHEGEVVIKDANGVPVAQTADRAWFHVQKMTPEALAKSLEGVGNGEQREPAEGSDADGSRGGS